MSVHVDRGTNRRPLFWIAILALSFVVSSQWLVAGPSGGRIAWQIPTSGTPSDFPPAIGPFGTVYTGNGDNVTAVSRDGDVLWVRPATARQGTVDVGSDGTVYAVDHRESVVALDPSDGSLMWEFAATGGNIVGGPGVGPDGNIYAVADAEFGGLGMFALDPRGRLLWSDPGDPVLSDHGGLGHRLAFSESRVFVAMRNARGGTPFLWAYGFDGSLAYVLADGCQGQPIVGPGDRVVTGNGICQEMRAYDATNGELLVAVAAPSQSPCSGMTNVAVGPDGSMYAGFCHRALWSVDALGSERWFDDDFQRYFMMDHLGVAPDGSVLLDLGRAPGSHGWVRAYNTRDGGLDWEIVIPPESGNIVQSTTKPAFYQGHRSRAYFNAVVGVGTGQSVLIAVDLGSSRTMAPRAMR